MVRLACRTWEIRLLPGCGASDTTIAADMSELALSPAAINLGRASRTPTDRARLDAAINPRPPCCPCHTLSNAVHRGMPVRHRIHRQASWQSPGGPKENRRLMQPPAPFLVPTAATALIAAIALSVTTLSATTAAVPVAGSQPPPAAGSQPPPATHRAGTTSTAETTVITGAHATALATTTTREASQRSHSELTLTFTWPLSPRPEVYRPFEQPRSQWSHGHRGVDLVAAVGQPVLSAGEGVVAFSGVVAGRGVITVRHSRGLRTSYEPVDIRLTSGAPVRRGARIGVVSATAGHCVPLTCLHWGAISGQAYRDPLSLLGFGRPILLPLG